MKKVFSLLLAALVLVSALPVAYAVDYTEGTIVEYTAANNESYTIDVPAKLAPGQGGTVTLSGTWPHNKTVYVTADTSVTLTNSLNADEQKVLNIAFSGIEAAGSNIEAQTFTQQVSVSSIENALFGTWSGKFNYNVEVEIQQPIAATFNDGTELTWDELKLEENGTKYNYNASAITDISIGDSAFEGCHYLTSVSIPDSVTTIGDSAFKVCSSLRSIDIPDSVTSIGNSAFGGCGGLRSINYAGTTEQWNAIMLDSGWAGGIPATEVTCSDGTVPI